MSNSENVIAAELEEMRERLNQLNKPRAGGNLERLNVILPKSLDPLEGPVIKALTTLLDEKDARIAALEKAVSTIHGDLQDTLDIFSVTVAATTGGAIGELQSDLETRIAALEEAQEESPK